MRSRCCFFTGSAAISAEKRVHIRSGGDAQHLGKVRRNELQVSRDQPVELENCVSRSGNSIRNNWLAANASWPSSLSRALRRNALSRTPPHHPPILGARLRGRRSSNARRQDRTQSFAACAAPARRGRPWRASREHRLQIFKQIVFLRVPHLPVELFDRKVGGGRAHFRDERWRRLKGRIEPQFLGPLQPRANRQSGIAQCDVGVPPFEREKAAARVREVVLLVGVDVVDPGIDGRSQLFVRFPAA